jgi:hypothetical protein
MIGGIPRGRVRTMSNPSARELTQSTAAVQEIGRYRKGTEAVTLFGSNLSPYRAILEFHDVLCCTSTRHC